VRDLGILRTSAAAGIRIPAAVNLESILFAMKCNGILASDIIEIRASRSEGSNGWVGKIRLPSLL
jgi:hypothetical protein